MEWIALVSALLVLLSAMMYHAAKQEMVIGNESESLNVRRLLLVDLVCVSLLVVTVTCAYMLAMASAPLLGTAWRALRRQRKDVSATVSSAHVSEIELRSKAGDRAARRHGRLPCCRRGGGSDRASGRDPHVLRTIHGTQHGTSADCAARMHRDT